MMCNHWCCVWGALFIWDLHTAAAHLHHTCTVCQQSAMMCNHWCCVWGARPCSFGTFILHQLSMQSSKHTLCKHAAMWCCMCKLCHVNNMENAGKKCARADERRSSKAAQETVFSKNAFLWIQSRAQQGFIPDQRSLMSVSESFPRLMNTASAWHNSTCTNLLQ